MSEGIEQNELEQENQRFSDHMDAQYSLDQLFQIEGSPKDAIHALGQTVQAYFLSKEDIVRVDLDPSYLNTLAETAFATLFKNGLHQTNPFPDGQTYLKVISTNKDSAKSLPKGTLGLVRFELTRKLKPRYEKDGATSHYCIQFDLIVMPNFKSTSRFYLNLRSPKKGRRSAEKAVAQAITDQRTAGALLLKAAASNAYGNYKS